MNAHPMCGLAKEVVCMLYQRLAAYCLLVRLCMLIQAQSLTLVSQTRYAVTLQSKDREREIKRTLMLTMSCKYVQLVLTNAK
jgi:hypothetical protein